MSTQQYPPHEPVPEWDTSDYLVRNAFERLAARRCELKEARDAVDKEIRELNLEIGAMLATAKLSSVRFGHYRLTLGFTWRGGQISKARLLEAGVTADQIERATSAREPGEAYVSVTGIWRRRKDGAEVEE